MMHRSHVTIGLFAAAAIATQLVDVDEPKLLAVAALASVPGSLIPDADHKDAQVHKLTDFERSHTLLALAGWLARLPLKPLKLLKHRCPVTHGFPAIALVLCVMQAVRAETGPLPTLVAVGFACGYLAHLWADGATVSGLPGYPFCKHIYTLPSSLRVTTGTRRESIYATLAFVATVAIVALSIQARP
jgi:membrane-bound metal-dependent hydrolase YbcI (DUF457 family)